jgi:hypothetical protein
VVDCSAKKAKIFGEAIIYGSTSPFRNIGFWQGERDHAVGTVDLPQEGAYDIYLDYACNPPIRPGMASSSWARPVSYQGQPNRLGLGRSIVGRRLACCNFHAGSSD